MRGFALLSRRVYPQVRVVEPIQGFTVVLHGHRLYGSLNPVTVDEWAPGRSGPQFLAGFATQVQAQ